MENASKALIMAGGILLAILIISMIVLLSSSTKSFLKAQNDQKLAQEIENFNKGYLAYNKTVMYGTDIITVVNKANEYNKTIDVNDIKNKVIIEIYNNEEQISISYNEEFKISIFKCESIGYNNETGKINKMIFKLMK